jgi:alpha-L-fucosidase
MQRLAIGLALILAATAASTQQPSPDPRAARLAEIERVANGGPFQPTWDSLEGFQVPAWYVDGKFGIFIHWGVYSVPAFGNEWYPRNMYKAGTDEFRHHVDTYGPQARFGYKDFIPLFKAERFDARRWAALFKDAGAKFVVPVAEHHDGFPMYAYPFTEWSAARMGPKRDVIGQLADAVRRAGLVFGASSHRAEHWWFFDQGTTFDSDVRDPRYEGFYGPARDQKAAESQAAPPDAAFLDDWLLRVCDLVDRHRPQLVWFDWWIAQPAFQPHLRTFAAFYYNRGAQWKQGVAINYKKHGGESFPDKAGVLDIERGQLAAIRPFFWQTDTAVARNSWGYTAHQDYKTADSIVGDLVDIVSKNGALLLNIGPRPDGTIPEPDEAVLRGIGRWLGRNGDAIYGTRPWKVFGEGPTEVVEGPFADTKRKAFTTEDIRFTAKGETLYAIALAWPKTGRIVIHSLARPGGREDRAVARVELLGDDQRIAWEQTGDGLVVTLPVARPGEPALALRIGFASTR